MALLADVISWACILAGGAFLIIGAIGMLRLPGLFTRLHGAGVIDTLGAGLILLGLAFQAGPGLGAVKLLLILAFLFLSGPAATHALAKAAMHGGRRPVVFHEEEDL